MLVLVPLSGTALGTGMPTSGKKLLVVGASGGTGMRAIRGLLDVGYEPEQLRILTRDPSKPTLAPLRERGFDLVAAVPPHSDRHACAPPHSDHHACVFRGRCPSAPQDLDDPATLSDVGASCTGCYVHSTAGDTKQLDTGEVSRARHLAEAQRRLTLTLTLTLTPNHIPNLILTLILPPTLTRIRWLPTWPTMCCTLRRDRSTCRSPTLWSSAPTRPAPRPSRASARRSEAPPRSDYGKKGSQWPRTPELLQVQLRSESDSAE